MEDYFKKKKIEDCNVTEHIICTDLRDQNVTGLPMALYTSSLLLVKNML